MTPQRTTFLTTKVPEPTPRTTEDAAVLSRTYGWQDVLGGLYGLFSLTTSAVMTAPSMRAFLYFTCVHVSVGLSHRLGAPVGWTGSPEERQPLLDALQRRMDFVRSP